MVENHCFKITSGPITISKEFDRLQSIRSNINKGTQVMQLNNTDSIKANAKEELFKKNLIKQKTNNKR